MKIGTIVFDRENIMYKYEGIAIAIDKSTGRQFVVVQLIEDTLLECGTRYLYDKKTFDEMFVTKQEVEAVVIMPECLPYKHCKKCKYGIEGSDKKDAKCIYWGEDKPNYRFRKKCNWFEKK